jgi:hypothetical protein
VSTPTPWEHRPVVVLALLLLLLLLLLQVRLAAVRSQS